MKYYMYWIQYGERPEETILQGTLIAKNLNSAKNKVSRLGYGWEGPIVESWVREVDWSDLKKNPSNEPL